MLARVDCDSDEARPVCDLYEVDAFPTIAVLRRDPRGESRQEVYHGERSLKALTKWITLVLAQKKAAGEGRRVDVDSDGSLESHEGVGCRVSGVVHVQRSPGILHFQARTDGLTLDAGRLDMRHTVHHLAFGRITKKEQLLLPADLMASWSPLDGLSFGTDRTDSVPMTHEHSIKVVKHRVQVGPGQTVLGHAYVAHSAQVSPPQEQASSVRISYDTLPFTVQVGQLERQREPLGAFLTHLAGILGGVLALAGLLAAFLHRAAGWAAALTSASVLPP